MDEATGLATAGYFRGRWQMVRLIDDRLTGAFGEFWGEAVFSLPAPSDFASAPGRTSYADIVAGPGADEDGASRTAAPAPAGAAGCARSPASPVVLSCRETGVLRLAGRDFAAGRATLWRFEPDGSVHVTHEDGSAFHSFRPEDPRALHHCGADRYEVEYEFAPGTWLSHWDVRGPRKDYGLRTRYCRIVAD